MKYLKKKKENKFRRSLYYKKKKYGRRQTYELPMYALWSYLRPYSSSSRSRVLASRRKFNRYLASREMYGPPTLGQHLVESVRNRTGLDPHAIETSLRSVVGSFGSGFASGSRSVVYRAGRALPFYMVSRFRRNNYYG